MSGEMVPAGNGAGTLAAYDKANASGAIAPLPPDVLGGGGFSETWKIDSDNHVFVNKKTNEARKELFVQVPHGTRQAGSSSSRARTGGPVWSDDGKSSYNGIDCRSCPRISEVDSFNKFYEERKDLQRPQYVGDCNLRYNIVWQREFVQGPNGLVLFEHDDRVFLNAPKSTIYAMVGANAYLTKLQQQGLDITQVVTKIKVNQRENKQLKKWYDFADFEYVGTVQEIVPRVTQTIRVASGQSASAQAVGAAAPAPAQAAFPQGQAQSFPQPTPPGTPTGLATAGLPTMSGPQAPVAAPTGFPGAQAPTGFPGAQAPAQAPTGFPGAQAPAPTQAAPSMFPGAVAGPQATPAQAPAQPQAQPGFADAAKTKLVQDFAALPDTVKPIVLNVLGVQKIEDIGPDRVLQASQAVASAKSFQPSGAAAAAPAGTGGQGGSYPF